MEVGWLRLLLSNNLRKPSTKTQRKNGVENGRLKRWTKAMIEVIKLGQARHSAQGVVDTSFHSFHVWRKLTFAPLNLWGISFC